MGSNPSVMGLAPAPACSFLTFQNGVSLTDETNGLSLEIGSLHGGNPS
jgi:hypothetical protein